MTREEKIRECKIRSIGRERGEIENAILEALCDLPRATTCQLARSLGIKANSAQRALGRMAGQKLVVKVARKRPVSSANPAVWMLRERHEKNEFLMKFS